MSIFKYTFLNFFLLEKDLNNKKENFFDFNKKIKTKVVNTNIKQLKHLDINFFIPIWGDEYVNNFLKYSLPSFISPDNIKALSIVGPNSKLIVWTTDEDKQNIEIINPMARHNIVVGILKKCKILIKY